MENLKQLKDNMGRLRLAEAAFNLDQILEKATKEKPSYTQFLMEVTKAEIDHRNLRDVELKLKKAQLPRNHDLEHYDLKISNGLDPQQLKQLRELHWVDQNFNIILMGPSGVGKTYIAAGLAFDAIKAGYAAIFRPMEQIVRILKLKDLTRSERIDYQRIIKADLLVIDDLMMFPVEKEDANRLFHLINQLHEQTAIIITTNKGPKEWAELMGDQVLATAILDRLLFRCQVISLDGKSYRMQNKKSIFKKENQK
jgi:DNA replication protein DnaC